MGTISAPIDTLIGLAIFSSGVPVYFIAVRPIKSFKWVTSASGEYNQHCQLFTFALGTYDPRRFRVWPQLATHPLMHKFEDAIVECALRT